MRKQQYLVYFLLCFSWKAPKGQATNFDAFCTNYANTYMFLSNKAVSSLRAFG